MRTFSLPLQVFDKSRHQYDVAANAQLHTDATLSAWDRQQTRDIRIFRGTPDLIVELDDLYYLPNDDCSYFCLYDRDGWRINLSCVHRGSDTNFSLPYSGPERLPIPKDVPTIDEPVIFLSYLTNHWGHFICDSTSRLWALKCFPELKALTGFYCGDYHSSNPGLAFLRHFDLAHGENLLTASSPVRLRKCFIPAASFSDGGEFFSAHYDLFRDIGRKYRKNWHRRHRPVYFSRARFKLEGIRTIARELELESILSDHGVDIVYPELLSLEEIIALVNENDIFLGCWGSAFHNLLFRCEDRPLFEHMFISNIFSNMNYLMIDAIMGTNANYTNLLIDRTGEESDYEVRIDRIDDYVRRYVKDMHPTPPAGCTNIRRT